MMKKCPQCQRTYTDETLSFCLDDGTVLTFLDDDFETTVLPKKKSNSLKIFVAISAIAIVFVLGMGLILGLYQYRNEIGSLFTPEPATEKPTKTPDTPPEITEEEKILNVLKDVRESYIDDDYDKLETLIADEYVEENSLGQKVTKKEILSPVQIGKKISLKHSDVKAEVNGDKATATGKGVQKGEIAGVEISVRFTFKTKFKKEDGMWKATYSYINIKQ